MNKIQLKLSPGQEQKLRNQRTIRVTPAMVGHGSEIMIDPMTYHNLSKSISKNKGMLLSLSPELIQTNMSGGSLMAGLKGVKKVYDKLPERTKSSVRRTVKDVAKGSAHAAVDTGFALASSNPYTLPAAVIAKSVYDDSNVDRFIDKKINAL